MLSTATPEPGDDDESRERCRRRSPAADLHLLPPGAGAGSPGRAHAAHPRRPHHRRDRARVPRSRAHHGAAPRAREAQDPQRRHPVPRAAGAPAAGAHRRGAGGALPAVQRGVLGHERRRPRAPGAVRRRHPPRPHPRRADARRTRGRSACSRSCSCTTPAAPGASTTPARWCRSKSRTARSGSGPASTRGSRCSTRRCGDASPARIRCRRPSPRATPPRATRARPTGWRSPRSTASWRGWCRRRSWSSTARSRWRWPTVPTRGCASSTSLEASGALDGYHLLPATRADLLRRLDRNAEAAVAYREALELAATDAERQYLNRRLEETLGRATG